LGHVVIVRWRPVRVRRRRLGVLRRYRCRWFWIGNAWGLIPAIAPAAGRRRFTLLLFDNYGPDTSAFRPVVGTRIYIRLAVAARGFAMRYVNLVAPWTPGIGRSWVTGQLFFGL
jgi:hypothetical protein